MLHCCGRQFFWVARQPLLITILGWASWITSNGLHLLHPMKLVCGQFGYWWGLNHPSFIKTIFTPRLQANSAIISAQNPLAVSTASSSRNYRGINLWLQPPKAFLRRYRMICWTALSSERFNEKKAPSASLHQSQRLSLSKLVNTVFCLCRPAGLPRYARRLGLFCGGSCF